MAMMRRGMGGSGRLGLPGGAGGGGGVAGGNRRGLRFSQYPPDAIHAKVQRGSRVVPLHVLTGEGGEQPLMIENLSPEQQQAGRRPMVYCPVCKEGKMSSAGIGEPSAPTKRTCPVCSVSFRVGGEMPEGIAMEMG